MPGIRSLRASLLRLTGLFRKRGRELDLNAEFESHFAMHVDDNLRRGMSPAEARREARLKFGSVDSAMESMREGSTSMTLETTIQDLRYALRGLRRNPAFAATAILSLALGTGAAVAIFSIADSLLLRPLPYRDPDRLMMVWEVNPHHTTNRNLISPANYFDWKAQNTVFERMAIFTGGPSAFSDGGRVEEFEEQYVSADLLPMLGVQPWRGRLFTAPDDLPHAPDVILISYRLWQSWFGGEDSVIGRKVQVRSRPFTIIGVMPPGFYFRDRNTDLWEPMGLDPARDYRANAGRYLMSVARLKPGVSPGEAQAQMAAIARRLEEQYPKFDTHWTVNVEPVRESLVSEVRTSLLVLLGAVGLLLAVACANVANLLLARYTSRRREMAVRAAIGAGRGRVVRQLLTESVALSLAAGLLGFALARLAISGLLAAAPLDLSRNVAVHMDARIVAFALGVSLLTGVVFGLAPIFEASRSELTRGMRESGRTTSGSARTLRNGLVASEVALSVMLLAGAGLLFRTLIGLHGVDPGLNPANMLTFQVQIPTARYIQPLDRTRFFTRALEQIQGLPGVQSASAVSYLPFNGLAAGTDLTIAGRPPVAPGGEPTTVVRTVLPNYFQTMGIPLKRGRLFTRADNTLDSPYRFVVNEAFVEKYFRREDPLTARISVDMDDKHPFGEIIGVVGNVLEGALDKEPQPTVYYIHAHLVYTAMVFVARVQGDPLRLAEPARRAIQKIDPALPVTQMRTMDAVVGETFARQRFSAVLLAAFSIVAVLLAAVGIYGVLGYAVTERTREIGVRTALGAEPSRIVALILGSGMRVACAGAALGMVGAWVLTGLLRTLLFGVRIHDATTFIAVPAILIAVALAASWLPAHRASRLPPVDALRTE